MHTKLRVIKCKTVEHLKFSHCRLLDVVDTVDDTVVELWCVEGCCYIVF